MKLYVGTTNQGKVREIANLLHPIGFDIHILAEKVPELGDSFRENAICKAKAYSLLTDEMVLVEDSGLIIPALNGLPGVHSSNLFELNDGKLPENITYDRNQTIDNLNNDKLVSLLKDANLDNTPAYFESYFVLAKNSVIVQEFVGRSYGYVIQTPRGTNGFGYDPHFVGSDTFGYTYAEIDDQRKNLKSHRRLAMNKIFDYFANQLLQQ